MQMLPAFEGPSRRQPHASPVEPSRIPRDEVVGQVLEVESWHVAALRVKLNSAVTEELGASHGAFRAARLDVPTDFIQGVTDTVILRGPVSALRTLQTQAAEQPAT